MSSKQTQNPQRVVPQATVVSRLNQDSVVDLLRSFMPKPRPNFLVLEEAHVMTSPPYHLPVKGMKHSDTSISLSDSGFIPIGFQDVSLTSTFWSSKVKLIASNTIPAMHSQLVKTLRLEYLKSTWKEGLPYKPNKYDESDVTKFIEASCYALHHDPPNAPEIRAWVDEAIQLLGSSQHDDGYLSSYIDTVQGGKRFHNIRDLHELYNAGHLLEAAIAHASLDPSSPSALMRISLAQLNNIDLTFRSPSSLLYGGYPGHQELEIGLMRLYKYNGDERWAKLAEFFIEERGKGGKGEEWERGDNDGWIKVLKEECDHEWRKRREDEHFYDWELSREGIDPKSAPSWWNMPWHYAYWYMQSHLPIREQTSVRGHAVRVVYWLTAATDVALFKKDASLYAAVETLYASLERKSYVTGGIGSNGSWEGFSDRDYDLPNEAGAIYAETCAAVGLVFLLQRMLQADLDRKYADRLEWTLYNAVSCGISADGRSFFYDNPLEVFGNSSVKRQDWFSCSCCPPNVSRLFASFGGFLYFISNGASNDPIVVVNLYSGSTVRFPVGEGKFATLIQETEYPREGEVRFKFEGLAPEQRVGLKLRIPGWATGYTLSINGTPLVPLPTLSKGYLTIPPRTWNSLTIISLTIPFPLQIIKPHPLVHSNVNKRAFHRGPILLTLESIDHPNVDLRSIRIPRNRKRLEYERCTVDDALGLRGRWGVRIQGQRVTTDSPDGCEQELRFIPYFAWANRGVGDMITWIPLGM